MSKISKKKSLFGGFFVLALIGGMLFGLSSSFSNSEEGSPAEADKFEVQTVTVVGEKLEIGQKQIVVNSVKVGYGMDDNLLPSRAGKEYIQINLTLKNLTTDIANYSYKDFYLSTATGGRIDSMYPPAGALNDFIYNGSLSKNGTITASLLFWTEKTKTDLDLVFAQQFWDDIVTVEGIK